MCSHRSCHAYGGVVQENIGLAKQYFAGTSSGNNVWKGYKKRLLFQNFAIYREDLSTEVGNFIFFFLVMESELSVRYFLCNTKATTEPLYE